jgi:hypothetical protein
MCAAIQNLNDRAKYLKASAQTPRHRVCFTESSGLHIARPRAPNHMLMLQYSDAIPLFLVIGLDLVIGTKMQGLNNIAW